MLTFPYVVRGVFPRFLVFSIFMSLPAMIASIIDIPLKALGFTPSKGSFLIQSFLIYASISYLIVKRYELKKKKYRKRYMLKVAAGCFVFILVSLGMLYGYGR